MLFLNEVTQAVHLVLQIVIALVVDSVVHAY